MPHVQTQPQPGIVDLRRDLHQHVRPRLHHVFHRQHHVCRYIRQQLPPENDGLLHEPLREVYQWDKAAVYHHPCHAQCFSRSDGLAEPAKRRVPHQRINGAGGQLRERRVEPQPRRALRLPARQRHGIGLLQPRGPAELRDLKAKTALLCQLRRAAVHPGQMQLFLKLPSFQGRPSSQVFQQGL